MLRSSKDDTPEVGDLLSKERGTGARFNQDKSPYEYLPLKLLLGWLSKADTTSIVEEDKPRKILHALAEWQTGDDSALDEAIELSLDRLDLSGFAEAARVFKIVTTREVRPYPMWNWMKSMKWMIPYGCAIRHLLAEIDGVELDAETNLRHRAHTMCNLIMLLYYRDYSEEDDNRPFKNL